ncbi:hypothetical protein ACFQVA_41015 [Actinomadura keratinilytica]
MERGGADGELVLLGGAVRTGGAGEDPGEPGGGAVVEPCGQVEQAAPDGGEFERGDPAEPPELVGVGVAHPVGGGDRDRLPGQAPERRLGPGGGQRLDQRPGERQAQGDGAGSRQQFPGGRRQADDAPQAGTVRRQGGADAVEEPGGVGVLGGEFEQVEGGPVAPQSVEDGGRPGVVRPGGGRYGDEPPPLQRAAGSGGSGNGCQAVR